MQLFITAPNVTQAWIVTLEMGKNDKSGYDAYYGEEEHLLKLAQCGFNTIEEYETAVDKSPWVIAYNKYNEIFDLARKSNTGAAEKIRAALKDNGFWNEEDHRLHGEKMLKIVRVAAPKEACIIETLTEIGVDASRFKSI